jgi:hypothetical protein
LPTYEDLANLIPPIGRKKSELGIYRYAFMKALGRFPKGQVIGVTIHATFTITKLHGSWHSTSIIQGKRENPCRSNIMKDVWHLAIQFAAGLGGLAKKRCDNGDKRS